MCAKKKEEGSRWGEEEKRGEMARAHRTVEPAKQRPKTAFVSDGDVAMRQKEKKKGRKEKMLGCVRVIGARSISMTSGAVSGAVSPTPSSSGAGNKHGKEPETGVHHNRNFFAGARASIAQKNMNEVKKLFL